MRVFEMCSSINGKYLIAAEFEKQIQIWDTECNEKICDIKTHFLGGGKRLTVSNSGKNFSAVNYGRYGIELYSTENHMLLWQNKTIKQIQCVYFSADDSILYAINNDGKLYSLSVSDGNIESIEKNICYLFLSESGMLKLSKTNELIYGALKIPSSDFNYCDIYPADEVFYYSLYGAKGLFCCDAAGTVLWHNTKTTGNIIKSPITRSIISFQRLRREFHLMPILISIIIFAHLRQTQANYFILKRYSVIRIPIVLRLLITAKN